MPQKRNPSDLPLLCRTPGGVFGAACRLFQGYSEDWVRTPFYASEVASQLVSAALFVALCLYLWFGSLRDSLRHKEKA
jgi:hypothetical protein